MHKADLTGAQIDWIRRELTIIPSKLAQFDDGEDPKPIYLYRDEGHMLGIAREYFLQRRRNIHEVKFDVVTGEDSDWFPAAFNYAEWTLRPEQIQGIEVAKQKFAAGHYGGILRAVPGWGKTVVGCAMMAELDVPTLVVVHKEFLVNQWIERITGTGDDDLPPLLPHAKVGRCQQNVCDFRGKTVVIGMVHSLGSIRYDDEFYRWPGLVIFDEVHRVGAYTWAPVPARFPSRYRLGLSATPRRKDGADNVFFHHIGPILFSAKEQRLKPKLKRIWTKFKLVKTEKFNPNLASKPIVLRFLCGSVFRNRVIVEAMIEALAKDRKLFVLSERLKHLDKLDALLAEMWPIQYGACPSTGFYVGGRKKDQLREAARARVIFATWQFASEGLDIPAMDTLFMATPMSDVEQAVGRILRPHKGKKDPVVVDIRDDNVAMFKKMGKTREKFYDLVC